MTSFQQPQEQYNQHSKDMNHKSKSLFGSKTFWGIVFTSTAAIAPIVGEDVDAILKGESVDYGQDIAQIVVVMCGAAASIVGRVEAQSPVYTPKWMPGPNEEDSNSENVS